MLRAFFFSPDRVGLRQFQHGNREDYAMRSSTRCFTEGEALNFFTKEILFGNAAGVSRDPKQLTAFVRAGATMATFGTIRQNPYSGNAGENFFYDETTGNAVNALGVPDAGIKAHLPTLTKLCQNFHGAKLVVSIMGDNTFDPDVYTYMAHKLLVNGAAHIVEGNFACPNIEVDGKRKPVVSYHMGDLRAGVRALREGAGDMPIGVKIAPITEASVLGEIADICMEFGVDFIVAANTIGNCYLDKEDGTDAIDMKLGGLSGAGLRPMVRAMVSMLVPLVKKSKTRVIAAGGIACGHDAYDYLRRGAHGVSFNTALYRRGGDPKVISEIALGEGGKPGLIQLLAQHGLPQAV